MFNALNRHLIRMFPEVTPLLSTYPMSINYLYTLHIEELPLYVNAEDPYFRVLIKYRLREGV